MISLAILLAACLSLVGTVVARARGIISSRTFYALVASTNCVGLIVSVAVHNQITASINAASTAIAAYMWWRDGGGDDTKRRLRRWARKFHGVRRTAPATGAA